MNNTVPQMFFKDRAPAWNGLVAWHIPLTMFSAWVLGMSLLQLPAIARWDAREGGRATPQEPGVRESLR